MNKLVITLGVALMTSGLGFAERPLNLDDSAANTAVASGLSGIVGSVLGGVVKVVDGIAGTVGRLLSKEGVEPKLAQSMGKDVAESLVKTSDKQSNQLSESINLNDGASDALLFDTLLTVAGAVTNIGGKILGSLLSKGVEPEVAKKVADQAAKEIEAEMAK